MSRPGPNQRIEEHGVEDEHTAYQRAQISLRMYPYVRLCCAYPPEENALQYEQDAEPVGRSVDETEVQDMVSNTRPYPEEAEYAPGQPGRFLDPGKLGAYSNQAEQVGHDLHGPDREIITAQYL